MQRITYSKYVTPAFSLNNYSPRMRDVPGYCCSKRHRNRMISATAWCMNQPWSWFGSSVQNAGLFYRERRRGVHSPEVDPSCLCLRCMSLIPLVPRQDVHPAACAGFAHCRFPYSNHRLRWRNPHLHMDRHRHHTAATLTTHPRVRDCRLTWMRERRTMQRRAETPMMWLHWILKESIN